MMIGIKTLGRKRLRRTFVNGSKTEYEIKKMVRVSLYCVSLIWVSSCKPSSFAFPIFVLYPDVLKLVQFYICLWKKEGGNSPIQERNKIQQTQPWNEPAVQLPKQSSILSAVSLLFLPLHVHACTK